MAIVIGAISAAAYVALLAIKAVLSIAYARRYPAQAAHQDLSPAAIVQPILGGDPDLEAALADNLEALPEARFVWLIDDGDAEADQVTAKMVRDHPAHRIERHVCPATPAGVNPKLFKLERARAVVTDGALVVLDDDTRLTRAGLAGLLAALETHTLATGLPCYLDRGGLPSRLVAQFVNNNAVLTYLPLLWVAAPPTINGMAYAIAPASLAAIGGFAPLWDQLADDLAVARRVLARSGTIAQTPYPQFISTTVRDWPHYRALMHRWFLFALLLLREQRPAWRFVIGVTHGLPPVLLWFALFAAISSPAWPGAAIAVGLLGVRAITLVIVQRTVTGLSRHTPMLSIVVELLQPLHLLHAACWRTIRWRTRRYSVHANDDFRPI
jgi:ceramide glucosyltransferase